MWQDGEELHQRLDEVCLFVQLVHEARFVLAKKWVLTVWPHIHSFVTSICDRLPLTAPPLSEVIAQVTVLLVMLCVD